MLVAAQMHITMNKYAGSTKYFQPSLVNHYRTQWLCRVPGALGKAQFAIGKGFAECCTRQRPLGKKWAGKGVFAECLLSVKLEPKKMEFFLIGGGPHRPAPAHLWHFSRKIHGYEAGGIRTGDLSLARPLL